MSGRTLVIARHITGSATIDGDVVAETVGPDVTILGTLTRASRAREDADHHTAQQRNARIHRREAAARNKAARNKETP